MSTFTGAQTAQKLDPTQELLKEFEAKLPQDMETDKDAFLLILKDWLYKSGNALVMLELLQIRDELIKNALIHQKEIMRKSALSKMAKKTPTRNKL